MEQNQLQYYLKQFGKSCLSYSTLQPGLEYYIEKGCGFIAYCYFQHWLLAPSGRKLILSDPVCADENKQAMLERFIAKYKNVTILQCSRFVAERLSELGYQVNHIGYEAELPLPNKLTGKHKAKLRQWSNKCQREKVIVEEKAYSECNPVELNNLFKQWLQKKGGKEMAFITRPFMHAEEPGVRYFWARQEGRLIGMAAFDPLYESGQVIGYYHNLDRILPDSPNGTSAYIVLQAMQQFAEEKCRYVSLGFMPFYALHRHFPHNEFTMKAFRFFYKHLNFLYPCKGSISHKKKFGGQERVPVYFSSTKGTRLWEMLILMWAAEQMAKVKQDV